MPFLPPNQQHQSTEGSYVVEKLNSNHVYYVVCGMLQISDLISSQSVALPLLKSTLSPSQWEIIEYISHALRQDYETRRQMVLQRLDVTIESFTWSDRLTVLFISVVYKWFVFVLF